MIVYILHAFYLGNICITGVFSNKDKIREFLDLHFPSSSYTIKEVVNCDEDVISFHVSGEKLEDIIYFNYTICRVDVMYNLESFFLPEEE